MSLEQNPAFLKKKYGSLHTEPGVVRTAERARTRGQAVPQKPEALIQNFLDRYREVVERKNPDEREQGLEAIKRLLYRTSIIKPKDIPESAFLLEQRIARELGYGTVELTDEFRHKKTQEIINNQKQSLDKWVDYLASPDAKYPDWAKYWIIRSVLDMGKLEKETDEEGREKASFKRRTKDTVSPFPPMNPRALAVTIDAILAKLQEDQKSKAARKPLPNLSKKLDAEAFQNLLSSENFSKIYTQFLIELPAYSTEGLQEIRGKWVKYPQGSDPHPLVDSLEGYPLEWCTAGFDTAQTQLQGGDFYVYYSIDQDNNPNIPRAAIRMEGDKIAEVRGIAPNQNLDPYIAPVLEKKLKSFGAEGETYKKKAKDMELLTAIENKVKAKKLLTPDDLRFLWEFDSTIEGFGYERDPRINEIRSTRNKRADMCVLFNCTEEELIQKEQFTLKNIPAFGSLPSESQIKKDYKFDWIWNSEYKKDRLISDFALTAQDLTNIGITDAQKQKELLDSVSQPKKESTPATIFDIGDVIRRKQKENPNHPNYLSTKEVLEAIDEAGFRPATLLELLAYGRDQWEPNPNNRHLLSDEQKLLQHADKPYISALGSPFSNSGGLRGVPRLSWGGGKRGLNAVGLARGWGGDLRFLVFRKESS